MTSMNKLTLFYYLLLSSFVLSKPVPADETSLSIQPPTSVLALPVPTVTPAPTPDGVATTTSGVTSQSADNTPLSPSETSATQPEPSVFTIQTASNSSPETPTPTLVENVVQDIPTTSQATPTPTPSKVQEDEEVRLSAESHIPQPPAYQDAATILPDTWMETATAWYTPLVTSANSDTVWTTETVDPTSTSTSSLVRTTYYATWTPQTTASYATLSSFATPSPSKSAAPRPINKSQGISPATQASRRAAIAGTLLAIFLVVSLVGCFLCMRCRGPKSLMRKRKSVFPQSNEDQEKGSIDEKIPGSPDSKSDSIDGMTLPVLPSDAPTNGSPPTQDRWRYLATNGDGQFKDVTDALVGGPYTEISLQSNTDIPSSGGTVSGSSTEDDTVRGENRTSSGATSTTQSYSTCTSRYSQAPQDMSLEDIDFLPSFLCAPPPVVKQGRARSRTLTNSTGGYPSAPLVSSSKSYPTKLSSASYYADSRLSTESARSGGTKRSTGSEWDVAKEYGRFSKESMGGSSILSAISEDPEHVEAVEVGKKNCLLVTGKF